MRDRVDGATASCAANSSSLYPLDSRSLRSSVPRRLRRTVGPVAIADPPPSPETSPLVLTTLLNAQYLPWPTWGNKRHDTAKALEVKSHPRFHGQTLPDALARGALARASSKRPRRPTGGGQTDSRDLSGKWHEPDI